MAGYVLAETEKVVVIATTTSVNIKTADMVQVWILHRTIHPTTAIKTGDSRECCGDCSAQGTWCYVLDWQAPASVWECYRNGGYLRAGKAQWDALAGRVIRIGAYGDPAFIPVPVLRKLIKAGLGYTGYTHQWRKPEYRWMRRHVMASVETEAGHADAVKAGWRPFRAKAPGAPKLAGEIVCPASKEGGYRTHCADCLLCDGKKAGDRRPSIVLTVHGAPAKVSKFISITGAL